MHMDPDAVVEELKALGTVVASKMAAAPTTKNLLVMGDFNADCKRCSYACTNPVNGCRKRRWQEGGGRGVHPLSPTRVISRSNRALHPSLHLSTPLFYILSSARPFFTRWNACCTRKRREQSREKGVESRREGEENRKGAYAEETIHVCVFVCVCPLTATTCVFLSCCFQVAICLTTRRNACAVNRPTGMIAPSTSTTSGRRTRSSG